jgi:hypothetical protein
MEAPQRGALMLVRVVGFTLIGWAVVDLALYLVICRHDNVPVKIFTLTVKSLPMLAGLVMLVKARAITEWVAEKLDL